MALFRDEKEALRRLEEALQEEQDEAEEYEYEEYDEEYDEDDEDTDGCEPDVSHIPIRNTDRTDLDPEELTQWLHRPKKRATAAAVIALLTIAAVFVALIWLVLRYR